MEELVDVEVKNTNEITKHNHDNTKSFESIKTKYKMISIHIINSGKIILNNHTKQKKTVKNY